ncbi:phloretin hydrolase [Apiospora phragmitis]|uniref:Phloretin hydrolase n=1 Tax=Apiospora phragmitis TaxID=2905665 RepID=A0ABR1VDH7_9PEZI
MAERHTTPDLPLPGKVPVTYYPPSHLAAVSAYARSNGSETKASHPEQVLPLEDVSRLLEPGYLEDGEAENGWCALSDGTAYVASKTHFPAATGEMIDWWFWWHSVEPERYALWYPYNHVEARSSFAGNGQLHRADLGHREKWLGSTHRVTEFIGPYHKRIRIQFVEPHDPRHHFGAGLTPEGLRDAGYVAAVCAVLWDAYIPLKLGEFVHLWRAVEGGLELRSRYWLGHQVYLQLPGMKMPLDRLGGLLGIKRMLAGRRSRMSNSCMIRSSSRTWRGYCRVYTWSLGPVAHQRNDWIYRRVFELAMA